MKKTARILSILLTLALAIGICTTAMAADYTVNNPTGFIGVPADATDVTLVTADGDNDGTPDLVKGWYVYNKDDLTYAGRNTPAWDTFYGSQVYVKSMTKWWGVNAGEKAASQSDGGQDENGYYRIKDGTKFYSHLIYVHGSTDEIMGVSEPLQHGIGVKPSTIDNEIQNYVLVNAEGYDYFYAITGITGSAFNIQATNIPTESGGTGTKGPDGNTGTNTVIYQIWGSKNAIADTETESKADDSSFVLIASGEIGGNDTGEFNVNVAEYKTLKLVTTVKGTKTQSNGGTECVWGEASLYNMPAGSTPSNPETADTFSALPVALLVLSGAAVAVIIKKKEN